MKTLWLSCMTFGIMLFVVMPAWALDHPFVEIAPADIARTRKLIDSGDPWAKFLYGKMKQKAIDYMKAKPPSIDPADAGEKSTLNLARHYLDIFRTFGGVYLLDAASKEPDAKASAMAWIDGGSGGPNGARVYLKFLLRLNSQPGQYHQNYNYFEPSHFLDLAELVHAESIAYDWMYDGWTSDERTALISEIDEHGLKVGLQAYSNAAMLAYTEAHDDEKTKAAKSDFDKVNQHLKMAVAPTWEAVNSGWWSVTGVNWNLVCNSGLTIGALVVKENYPEDSARIEKYSIESIKGTGFANHRLNGIGSLSEFTADGGYPEGPGYAAYASSYAEDLISTLFHVEGQDYQLLEDHPGLLKTGRYWLDNTGPTGLIFAISDVATGAARPPADIQWFGDQLLSGVFAGGKLQVSSLKGREIDPEAKADAAALLYHGPDTFYDNPLRLFYYIPTEDLIRSLPLDNSYKTLPTVMFRSGWGDANATYVAAYGGNNSANHAHLEMGNFVVDTGGIRLVSTLGLENYSLKGIGDEAVERWKFLRDGSEGQNTLLLSNVDKFPAGYSLATEFSNQALKGRGLLTNLHSSVDAAEATFDLSSGYLHQGVSQTVLRKFKLDGPQRSVVSVEDSVTPGSATDYKWQVYLSSKAQVIIAADGQSATIILNTNSRGLPLPKPVQTTIRLVSTSKATMKIESALPGDYESVPPPGSTPRQDKNLQYQRLAILMPKLPSGRASKIVVQMLPSAEVTQIPAPTLR